MSRRTACHRCEKVDRTPHLCSSNCRSFLICIASLIHRSTLLLSLSTTLALSLSMSWLSKAALEFNTRRFCPRLIFAVFGRRLTSPLQFYKLGSFFNIICNCITSAQTFGFMLYVVGLAICVLESIIERHSSASCHLHTRLPLQPVASS